jgi:hypothetical protein
LGGPQLLPDPHDRLDVLFAQRLDEVPQNGILERPRDLLAVAPALLRKADQRRAPIALVGAAPQIAGIDELLNEPRGAGGADADEPVGKRPYRLRLLVVEATEDLRGAERDLMPLAQFAVNPIGDRRVSEQQGLPGVLLLWRDRPGRAVLWLRRVQ